MTTIRFDNYEPSALFTKFTEHGLQELHEYSENKDPEMRQTRLLFLRKLFPYTIKSFSMSGLHTQYLFEPFKYCVLLFLINAKPK